MNMKRTLIACGSKRTIWQAASLRSALLAALLLVPLATLHAQDTTSPPSGPPPGQKWKLVFSDEFDGNAIDMTRWKHEPQRPWAIPGFQTKHSDENCAVDGKGHLVLRLTRDEDGTIRFNRGLRSRKFEKASAISRPACASRLSPAGGRPSTSAAL